MVPADVTSSNAGPVEVERLGEVDELAAEAQDLSSRGSDGGENSSSQPVGGRAREAHFFSLPVAENSEPPVAAALDAGAVLEAPATREQQLAALPSEQELGERAASMFKVGADDPASSGMPPAVQVVTKELVLRAWEVMTTLCKKAGKELSQSFGNFDKVMGLGWLLGDVVLGYLICGDDAFNVGRKAGKLAAGLKEEFAAPLRRAGKQKIVNAAARARAFDDARARVAAVRLEQVLLPLPTRLRAAQAASSKRRRVAAEDEDEDEDEPEPEPEPEHPLLLEVKEKVEFFQRSLADVGWKVVSAKVVLHKAESAATAADRAVSHAVAQLTRFASVADKPVRWPWEHHREPRGGKETGEAFDSHMARWDKETERRLARVRGAGGGPL